MELYCVFPCHRIPAESAAVDYVEVRQNVHLEVSMDAAPARLRFHWRIFLHRSQANAAIIHILKLEFRQPILRGCREIIGQGVYPYMLYRGTTESYLPLLVMHRQVHVGPGREHHPPCRAVMRPMISYHRFASFRHDRREEVIDSAPITVRR